MPKFIFITGGVLSSLGKGLTSAAIGAILESMGHKVAFLKLDPYLNIDPGTMNPYQHGEVFVLRDGTETDLDLGHYERFTNVQLLQHNSITAGKLYARLLDKERRGDFLGGTIQIVPHLTDEIKVAIAKTAEDADYAIIEIGGTIGDIEGLPFIEAIRQMGLYANKKNCLYIHLTYVPYIEAAAELKTKPTQHSIKELRSLGIQPDILICRSELPLSSEIKKKIALFTNVEEASVLSAPDLRITYELPLLLTREQLPQRIAHHLGLANQQPALDHWQSIVDKIQSFTESVRIAVVGKYVALKDAYKSVHEALMHAQIPNNTRVEIVWISAEDIGTTATDQLLKTVHAVLIPGGFGARGVEEKICVVQYAREHRVPFLGICLGMQVAVIEFARSRLGLLDAHSTEFIPTTKEPVVDLLEAQKQITHKGATMRLGVHVCHLAPESKAAHLYRTTTIAERHRHRYEFNPTYIPAYQQAGLVVSGMHETAPLPEIIEIPAHPYFIGCQFHPELQSKPYQPHPLFVGLVAAAQQYKNQ